MSVWSMHWPLSSASAAELSVDLRHEVGDPGRVGALLGDEVFDEVPRALEGEGEGAQLAGVDVGGVQQEDRALEVGIVEELVEDRVQRRSKATAEDTSSSTSTLGGQPRLDGVLGQQPLGERVQRADGGAVELGERDAAPLGLGPVAAAAFSCSAAAHTVAQLGARLLREGDGGHLAQLDRARGDQGHDPAHQRGGLPRAGARLDEQGGAEVVLDPVARSLIRGGGGRGHDPARLAQGV